MEPKRVSFIIAYSPCTIIKMGEVMSKLDLGIDSVSYNECEKWSWTTTTKVDEAYIAKMKAEIMKQLGNNGYNIEYIKYEDNNLV